MQPTATGLSPRMRGNPSAGICVSATQGLSPRMRGNPGSRRRYAGLLLPGLSPRMRGNPAREAGRSTIAILGVYPRACGGTKGQGEPGRPATVGVYPRACGGTMSLPDRVATPRMPNNLGLSPRMRGNPARFTPVRIPRLLRGGSIPAHAGEPYGMAVQTRPGSIPAQNRWGSIPAHAGEPSRSKRYVPSVHGSIPAHAGEPLVANLLILLVFKEQGDEGHPLTSLQE